jgi:hypothetical protein
MESLQQQNQNMMTGDWIFSVGVVVLLAIFVWACFKSEKILV